jgi:DNA-binding transcriptional ArsR family regulator
MKQIEKQARSLEAFAALAQGTRLEVVRLLVRAGKAGLAAGDIARAVGAPASTLSAHLTILARAHLVRAERRSRSIIYTADMAGLTATMAFLIEDCCEGRPEICAPLTRVLERAAACCAEG